jgi:hypothetical protein
MDVIAGVGDRETILNLHDETTGFASTPIADESLGAARWTAPRHASRSMTLPRRGIDG